jgi:hypothetical protein
MPLFLVDHPIVMLNPNSTKRNALEDMSNLNLFDNLFRKTFSRKGLFLVKAIINSGPNPA